MRKAPEIESVLLASGGLDSTTLAYWLLSKNVDFCPVFIDYGQHCTETELSTLLRVLPEHYRDQVEVIDVAGIYRGCSSRLIDEADLWTESVTYKDLYLPYRNLLLLTVGAAFAQARGYSYLYSAFINSNHAQEIDCSAQFFDMLAVMLADYGTVHLKMPFRDFSKFEVAKLGVSLGAPIGHTFSCQVSSVIPCGACPNCVDRLEALRQLGSQ
ncbi:MAG: 7-cyano-7-deazaguanine synthase [Chloroflexi bacterium]|nr:7-cyano-7-deazaguanine synthase [Chloroflexota bacterium]